MIEVGEKQDALRTADGDQNVAPSGLRLHPLAVHVPVRHVLDLDQVGRPQVVPERLKFGGDLILCLVVLHGDDERVVRSCRAQRKALVDGVSKSANRSRSACRRRRASFRHRQAAQTLRLSPPILAPGLEPARALERRQRLMQPSDPIATLPDMCMRRPKSGDRGITVLQRWRRLHRCDNRPKVFEREGRFWKG